MFEHPNSLDLLKSYEGLAKQSRCALWLMWSSWACLSLALPFNIWLACSSWREGGVWLCALHATMSIFLLAVTFWSVRAGRRHGKTDALIRERVAELRARRASKQI